mmetsp:Transcript_52030/g.111357  ORF Transcript_52030/g.111357 Transcript_52030/m.111357 type:complete len:225 (-) Transcript_52030:540-1214(-)
MKRSMMMRPSRCLVDPGPRPTSPTRSCPKRSPTMVSTTAASAGPALGLRRPAVASATWGVCQRTWARCLARGEDCPHPRSLLGDSRWGHCRLSAFRPPARGLRGVFQADQARQAQCHRLPSPHFHQGLGAIPQPPTLLGPAERRPTGTGRLGRRAGRRRRVAAVARVARRAQWRRCRMLAAVAAARAATGAAAMRAGCLPRRLQQQQLHQQHPRDPQTRTRPPR